VWGDSVGCAVVEKILGWGEDAAGP
jgi:hypothetical protein